LEIPDRVWEVAVTAALDPDHPWANDDLLPVDGLYVASDEPGEGGDIHHRLDHALGDHDGVNHGDTAGIDADHVRISTIENILDHDISQGGLADDDVTNHFTGDDDPVDDL
jgi:hypothetical protein